jgi:hypothetical protein
MLVFSCSLKRTYLFKNVITQVPVFFVYQVHFESLSEPSPLTEALEVSGTRPEYFFKNLEKVFLSRNYLP